MSLPLRFVLLGLVVVALHVVLTLSAPPVVPAPQAPEPVRIAVALAARPPVSAPVAAPPVPVPSAPPPELPLDEPSLSPSPPQPTPTATAAASSDAGPAPAPVEAASLPAVPTAAADPEPDPGLWGRYLTSVRSGVESKKVYPAAARSRNQSGSVLLRFVLDSAGGLAEGPEVLRSSGAVRLDTAAQDAVRAAAPFPPPPPGRGGSEFTITLEYQLR